jgi:hypothetical protein
MTTPFFKYTCAICRDADSQNELMCITCAGHHIFHENCLSSLATHNDQQHLPFRCPICRGFPFARSQNDKSTQTTSQVDDIRTTQDLHTIYQLAPTLHRRARYLIHSPVQPTRNDAPDATFDAYLNHQQQIEDAILLLHPIPTQPSNSIHHEIDFIFHNLSSPPP